MKKLYPVIVGLGKTGYACAQYLHHLRVPFAVTDSREHPPYLEQLQQLDAKIPLALGGFDAALMQRASELIVSQGIRYDQPTIVNAKQHGVPVIGDLELFARHVTVPVVAITGSNGKSTVTALLADMAKAAGQVAGVGGNFGTPAPELLLGEPPQSMILEVSNFQLETTYSLCADVATILNISPDHLDRYTAYEDYIAAKQRVYRGCKTAVINRQDPLTHVQDACIMKDMISFGVDEPESGHFGLSMHAGEQMIVYGDHVIIAVKDLALDGQQNTVNAMAALALGLALGLPIPAMCRALREFTGLAHRCQKVATSRGVDWYNDSKGTNVGASLAAIDSVKRRTTGSICLIAGGLAKTDDFSLLYEPINAYIDHVVLLGQATSVMKQAFQQLNTTIHCVSDLSAAVDCANQLTQSGDAVLFSPACASFDMFRDYVHRGEVFCQLVKERIHEHT